MHLNKPPLRRQPDATNTLAPIMSASRLNEAARSRAAIEQHMCVSDWSGCEAGTDRMEDAGRRPKRAEVAKRHVLVLVFLALLQHTV